jgi:hypothetical protein
MNVNFIVLVSSIANMLNGWKEDMFPFQKNNSFALHLFLVKIKLWDYQKLLHRHDSEMETA